MPLITRLFIKSGLIFFLVAIILGVISEIESFTFTGIAPLFWHCLMVGWITQIIMGISMWMFPGRIKEESLKHQRWGWTAFLFLNTGLWLRILAEPFLHTSDANIWKFMLVLSACLQLIAVIAYIIEIWPRVLSKSQRRKQRKSRG